MSDFRMMVWSSLGAFSCVCLSGLFGLLGWSSPVTVCILGSIAFGSLFGRSLANWRDSGPRHQRPAANCRRRREVDL